MKFNYSIRQRSIAWVLLVSFFLQNCTNFTIEPIQPIKKETTYQTKHKQGTIPKVSSETTGEDILALTATPILQAIEETTSTPKQEPLTKVDAERSHTTLQKDLEVPTSSVAGQDYQAINYSPTSLFLTPDNYHVQFLNKDNHWTAQVQGSWTNGMGKWLEVPVYLAPLVKQEGLKKYIDRLTNSPRWSQKLGMQVLFNQAIKNRKVPIGVHVGTMGLLGGAKTKLHEAIEEGDVEEAMQIISDSYSSMLDAQDAAGATALHRVVCCTIGPSKFVLLGLLFRYGHYELIKKLVEQGADINSKDHKGQTPLHWAVNRMQGDSGANIRLRGEPNYSSIIQILTSLKADINAQDERGYTPLHYAVENKNQQVIALLIELGADTDKCNKENDTPLHLAIQNGEDQMARKLIDAGAALHRFGKYGNTALHWAILQKKWDLVKYMLEKRSPFYWHNNAGFTPIELAAQQGKLDYITKIFSLNLRELNHRSFQDGLGHLHRAVQNKNLPLVQALLEAGINKDLQEQASPLSENKEEHRSALHMAIEQEDIEMILCLVAADAKKDIKDKDGKTAIDYALAKAGRPYAKSILAALGINLAGQEGVSQLNQAIRSNNVSLAQQLITAGVDINIADAAGDTPLQLAVRSNHVALVEKLVAAGANKDLKNKQGHSPLHLALQSSKSDLLLKALKINVQEEDAHGNTLLHHVVIAGDELLVKLLSNSSLGIDKNKRNKEGKAPLHLAVEQGKLGLVSLLIELGANKDAKDSKNNTSLQLAIKNGQNLIAKKLIDLKVSLSAKDDQGNDVLQDAIIKENGDLVKYLIDKGAWFYSKNKAGETPVELAASRGHLDYITKIFSANLRELNYISSQDGLGHLHRAIQKKELALVETLLKAKINKDLQEQIPSPQEKDKKISHRTALQMAVEQEDLPTVRALVAAGANKEIKDKDGKTAIDYAFEQLDSPIGTDLLSALNITAGHPILQVKLQEAIKAKDLDLVQNLVEAGADIHLPNPQGLPFLHQAIVVGNDPIILYCLSKGINKNAIDQEGNTPLHTAVRTGNIKIIRKLVSLGANKSLPNKAGILPIHLMITHASPALTLQLIAALSLKGTEKEAHLTTALHGAILSGKTNLVQGFLNLGAPINGLNILEETPLQAAIQRGDLAMVDFLVAQGASTQAKNKQGETPFYLALKHPDKALSKQLLQALQPTSSDLENLLQEAVISGNLLLVKSLLKEEGVNRLDRDATDAKQSAPLHHAAALGNAAMVEILLSAGATKHSQDIQGNTPLHLAVQKGHMAVVKLLGSHDPRPVLNQQGNTACHDAIEGGNPAIIAIFLNSRSYTNLKDNQGNTPLHLAVLKKDMATVEQLLKAQVYKNETNQAGDTPLHLAMSIGDRKIIEALVKAGADLQIVNQAGLTPLELASGHVPLKTLRMILKHDQRINQPNSAGQTHLHRAVKSNDLVLVKELIRHKAQVTITDSRGQTPLHHAAAQGNLDLLQELATALPKGRNLDLLDDNQQTPLHHAMRGGHSEVVKWLLAQGANLHLLDKEGTTPLKMSLKASDKTFPHTLLYQAYVAGDSAFIQELATLDVRLDTFDAGGKTLLHHAAIQGNIAMIKTFMAADIPLYIKDREGKTPLHHATLQGHEATAIFLIQAGADLYALDNHGYTPVCYLLSQKNLALVEILSRTYEDQLQTLRHAYQKNEKAIQQPLPSLHQARTTNNKTAENDASSMSELIAHVLSPLSIEEQASWQEQFLPLLTQHLLEKQEEYYLSPNAIKEVLTYLTPFPAKDALTYLVIPDDAWYDSLRLAWMMHQTDQLTHFSEAQRKQLGYASTVLPYDTRVYKSLIGGFEHEKDFNQVAEFLSFLVKNQVSHDMLFPVTCSPTPAEKSRLKTWQHYIACELLKDTLTQRYPGKNTATLEKQLDALPLENDALYETLQQLLSRKDAQASTELTSLTRVVELMNDYRLPSTTYKEVLLSIREKPCEDWEKLAHTLIIGATFGASDERSAEEIMDFMVAHAPKTHFVKDHKALTAAYKGVTNAHKKRATLSKSKKQLSTWKEAEVLAWAEQVKEKSVLQNGSAELQQEAIAVIEKAVELAHGHKPRATQRLALLAFINHAPGQGRLAQINTGEGKSLIVAMLAAFHALKGEKVDVTTTSSELSIPEVKKQTKFFSLLGLTVGENSTSEESVKKEIYAKDIVYGTSANFQGDILRTEFSGKDVRRNRDFGVVIVDEVDSMLFDSRTASIRLSGQTPAMSHLERLLASLYHQVHHILRHMIEVKGKTYYIPQDFQVHGDQITSLTGAPLKMTPVADKEAWVTFLCEEHLQSLLRDLDSDEAYELKAFKALEEKLVKGDLQAAIEKREKKLTKYTESQKIFGTYQARLEKHQKKQQKLTEEYARLEKSYHEHPWRKRDEVMEIPPHLKEFSRKQIPAWTKSAIQALCYLKKKLHYDVVDGKIVPIDYANTGVFQQMTVWGDGLSQMLQMKEGLPLHPENLSTNFLSIPEYFKRYKNKIYGLTGTLGNATTHQFLKQVYNVDLLVLPPYKHRPIAGNQTSTYLCKEFPATVAADHNAWQEAIIHTTLRKVRNGRASLIICKYVQQATELAKQLAIHHDSKKIFTYTGEGKFHKDKIDTGEIIIATNIAGRGTDITTSDVVEENGGLHVCITFLPDNYRVELQNAGRTARQGKRGTAQLVIYDEQGRSIATLRALRDEQEASAIQKAQGDIEEMLFRDDLFKQFCALEEELLSSAEHTTSSVQLNLLWSTFNRSKLPSKVDRAYEQFILKKAKELIASSPKDLSHIAQRADQALQELKEELYIKHPKITFIEVELKEKICDKVEGKYPHVVIEAFRQGKTRLSEGKSNSFDLVAGGKYERMALEEAWALWLHHAATGTKTHQEIEADFEVFSTTMRELFHKRTILRNPYHPTLQGNHLILLGDYAGAVKAFDTAIALDELHSVNALYNKALALLKFNDNKNNWAAAETTLERAKLLIASYHRPYLVSLNAMIGETKAKPELLNHFQYQVDILLKQEDYINAALNEIQVARDKEWNLEVSEMKPLDQIFEDSSLPRLTAINKASLHGLDHFFVLKAKEPFPWKSIVALAIIGIAQVAAGAMLVACTGGALGRGFISEGIGDLIAGVRAGIDGTFDWGKWAIQKAVSITVALITSGIEKIKEAYNNVKDTVSKLTGATQTVGGELVKETTKEITKKAPNIILKQIGAELGKGIAKELGTRVLDHFLEGNILKEIEEYIERKVAEKLEEKLSKNDLIKRALALDVVNQNNRFQELITHMGMQMLTERKNSKLEQYLEGVASGLQKHCIAQLSEEAAKSSGSKVVGMLVSELFKTAEMAKSLLEIMEMSDHFSDMVSQSFEKKYQKEIEKAEKEQQAQEKKTQELTASQNQSQPLEQIMSLPPKVEGEIEVTKVEVGTSYSSKEEGKKGELKNYYYGASSSGGGLVKALGRELTAKINQRVKGELVKPLTDRAVSWGVDKVSEGITEDIQKAYDAFCQERKVHNLSDVVGNTQQAEKEKEQGTTQQGTEKKPLSPEVEAKQRSISAGAPASIEDIAFTANAVGSPVFIYNPDRSLYNVIGEGLIGEPVKMIYTPPVGDDTIGHWEPKDKSIKVEKSSENNCFYDALYAQLSDEKKGKLEIKKVEDLRPLVAKAIDNNPSLADKFLKEAQYLNVLDEKLMMVGGRSYRMNVGTNKTPGSKYRTEYIDEKGGNDIDYIEYGEYDKDGNFIPHKEENGEKKVEEIQREGGKIIVIRFKESAKSTVSALLIPGDDKDQDIQGYGLEPKGPSTVEREQNQRILSGILDIEKHDGKNYKDVPKIYREEKGKDKEKTNVPKDRYVLIHKGNNYTATTACIVVGDTWNENGEILKWNKELKKMEYVMVDGKVERGDVVGGRFIKGDPRGPSEIKLASIMEFIRQKGFKNVKVIIEEAIPTKKIIEQVKDQEN